MLERPDLLKKLIAEIDGSNLRLNVSTIGSDQSVGDEIFHTPAISYCVLVLSNLRSFKLTVPETGHFVASSLQETVNGLKQSQSDLRWSVRLRSVCAEAIEFLELTNLVTVDANKIVSATTKGKEFLSLSAEQDPGLELFKIGIIRGLERTLTRGNRLL
ncbi:MAG TPA: hypothetical protein PLZ57_15450 [Pseudobdellovibrionaceae bacterium]|nr:hypothetical protein [Pseudobdellovibrionaceae bacterium]